MIGMSPEYVIRYVCWEMENRHRHGFVTDSPNWADDTNVPDYVWEGVKISNQGDYATEVAERERTSLWAIREYPWTDEGLKDAVEAGDLKILSPTGRFMDLDNEDDLRAIEEAGGLVAWATRYGIEVP